MNNIKKIINDPEQTTDLYNVTMLVILVYAFFILVIMGFQYWGLLIIPLFYSVYFCFIKTYWGKKYFKLINTFISGILIVTIIYFLMNIILTLGNLSSFINIAEILLSITFIAAALYWIFTFSFNKEQNKLVFKGEQSNDNYFKILSISFMGVMCFYLLASAFEHALTEYDIIKIIIIIGLMVLFLLKTRYIYLYQKYREGRK